MSDVVITDAWIEDVRLEGEVRSLTAEVLAVRRERQHRLGDLLHDATDAELQRTVSSPNGGETTVLRCVQVVLKEEWWHHHYAARDLAILEHRQA